MTYTTPGWLRWLEELAAEDEPVTVSAGDFSGLLIAFGHSLDEFRDVLKRALAEGVSEELTRDIERVLAYHESLPSRRLRLVEPEEDREPPSREPVAETVEQSIQRNFGVIWGQCRQCGQDARLCFVEPTTANLCKGCYDKATANRFTTPSGEG